MRIGIAARDLTRHGCGVGTYVSNIVEQLVRLDKQNEYVVFCQSNGAVPSLPGALIQPLHSDNKAVWDYLLLPRAVKKHKIDLLFCSKNVLPFGVDAKSVVSVHDLAYYDPSLQAYKWLDTLYMRQMIRSSVKRADGIIAISENTKEDILRTLEVPRATKMRVIHEAASEAFKPTGDEGALAACKTTHSLEGPFFFYAGGISPRKNLSRTVSAFARVAKDIPHTFVITGGTQRDSSFFETLTGSGLATRVKILGRVSEADLISLYNLADFSIYPSLYEGFGLPIVEAMSCGCPVACAERTSLPEVAGGAALLFNPLDEDSIAQAILRLATDKSARDSYGRKALSRAKDFSWHKTARETMDFFAEVGAS
jgi:glycosyltransferase involved in cell wall biosynthesis